jgi:hypothetical protein
MGISYDSIVLNQGLQRYAIILGGAKLWEKLDLPILKGLQKP